MACDMSQTLGQITHNTYNSPDRGRVLKPNAHLTIKNNNNVKNANKEVVNEIENAMPLVNPITRMKMTVNPGFTAKLTGVKPFNDINREGQKVAKMRFTFEAEEGVVDVIQQIHTAGTREYVTRTFNRALGCKTLSDIAGAIGRNVTLVTAVDQYDGAVRVKYINRYNPFAGEEVDLAAFDNEIAEEPEKLVFG